MKYLRRINESSIDQLAYIFKYANDNFEEILSSTNDLTLDQKIKYLQDSRIQLKNYLDKIDSQIKIETDRKISNEKDPIERLKAWIAKPKHRKSSSVVHCFDSLGRNFMHSEIYYDRHVTHSVIEILYDYFSDGNGNFVLGVPVENEGNNRYILTEKLIDDIIKCDVDEFVYDW